MDAMQGDPTPVPERPRMSLTTRTEQSLQPLRVPLAIALLVALILPIGVLTAHADLEGPTDGGRAIITSSRHEEVAEGISHDAYDRVDEKGTNHIDVLKVQLSRTDVSYLDSGKVAGVSTLSDMAAKSDVDAAVNGGFFDINNSGAALGNGVSTGHVVTTGNKGDTNTAVISKDGIGTLANLILDGTYRVNGGKPVHLNGLNIQSAFDGVTGYDDRWGGYPLQRSLGDAPGLAVLIGADGSVKDLDVSVDGPTHIGKGEHILLARGKDAATRLQALKVGDRVAVSVGISANADHIKAAIGGNYALVTHGNPMERPDGSKDAMIDSLHPRTAIGFSDDGKIMYLVTVDGRSDKSRGMSLPELARLMKELGATEAMNLDGGGSTTMIVRHAGDGSGEVVNVPSDGQERKDGNGLGITSGGSDGVLSGISLSCVSGADRVFPGTHRRIVAKPHDRGGRPVKAKIDTWRSSNDKVLSVADGLITAKSTGTADVMAQIGKITARTRVQVLGTVVRTEIHPGVLQLADDKATGSVQVIGHDAHGYDAVISPKDVAVVGDHSGLTLTPAENEAFKASASVDKASGRVNLRAAGHDAVLPFTVGTDDVVVTDMSEGVSGFRVDGARSTQALAGTEGPGDGHAVAVTMDFSTATATRTANLRPAEGSKAGRELPGGPTHVVTWIRGDGKNTPMMYAILTDADGKSVKKYGPRIKATTDWQQITFQLPQGFHAPMSWTTIGFYETDAALKYTTTVAVSGVNVLTTPAVDIPEVDPWLDPAIAEAGSTDHSPQRIAVMSDAQFVGRVPGSQQVVGARNTLREIVKAHPDILYIVGDFVDEANDEDFELAKRILDEELGRSGIPWTYVPGNHEVMGQPITNFEKFFGPATTARKMGATKIITLDSSSGKLRSNFEQVRMLRRELDTAAKDDQVSGVVVMFHHPTADFLPGAASQLADRQEAAMIEDWVTRFRRTSGKHIGVVNGHVGAFNTRQLDDVILHTNGNCGKKPDSTSDRGGWLGWTMLGVDPHVARTAAATDWMKIETKPFVDEGSLHLDGEDSAVPGEVVQLSGSLTQYGVEVPIRWPMSTKWFGDGVFVGDPLKAPRSARAAVDPATGKVTILRTGDVTLSLTVNGRTATHLIHVSEQLSPTASPTQSAAPASSPVVIPTGPSTVTPIPSAMGSAGSSSPASSTAPTQPDDGSSALPLPDRDQLLALPRTGC